MHSDAKIEQRKRLFRQKPREFANLMASVSVSHVLRGEWGKASAVCDEVLRADPGNCNAVMVQHRIRYSEAKAEADDPVAPTLLVDRRNGKVKPNPAATGQQLPRQVEQALGHSSSNRRAFNSSSTDIMLWTHKHSMLSNKEQGEDEMSMIVNQKIGQVSAQGKAEIERMDTELQTSFSKGMWDVCAECGQVGTRARCGSCKLVSYCSSACATAAWKCHKHVCKAGRSPEEATRLNALLHLKLGCLRVARKVARHISSKDDLIFDPSKRDFDGALNCFKRSWEADPTCIFAHTLWLETSFDRAVAVGETADEVATLMRTALEEYCERLGLYVEADMEEEEEQQQQQQDWDRSARVNRTGATRDLGPWRLSSVWSNVASRFVDIARTLQSPYADLKRALRATLHSAHHVEKTLTEGAGNLQGCSPPPADDLLRRLHDLKWATTSRMKQVIGDTDQCASTTAGRLSLLRIVVARGVSRSRERRSTPPAQQAVHLAKSFEERDPAGLCHDAKSDEEACPGICEWREDFLRAAIRLEGERGATALRAGLRLTEMGELEAKEAADWNAKSPRGVRFHVVDLEGLNVAAHHCRLAALEADRNLVTHTKDAFGGGGGEEESSSGAISVTELCAMALASLESDGGGGGGGGNDGGARDRTIDVASPVKSKKKKKKEEKDNGSKGGADEVLKKLPSKVRSPALYILEVIAKDVPKHHKRYKDLVQRAGSRPFEGYTEAELLAECLSEQEALRRRVALTRKQPAQELILRRGDPAHALHAAFEAVAAVWDRKKLVALQSVIRIVMEELKLDQYARGGGPDVPGAAGQRKASTYCAYCEAEEGEKQQQQGDASKQQHLLRCARCQDVFYCSVKCQKAHWKEGGHKQSCPDRNRRRAKSTIEAVAALERRAVAGEPTDSFSNQVAATGE